MKPYHLLLINLFCRDLSTALSQHTFVNFTGADFLNRNISQLSQATAKLLEAEQARAHRWLIIHMNHADETERQLGVEERWTCEDPWYVDALTYISNRAIIRAVEHLEGLVVQRLFELSKANLATMGA